MAKGAKKRIEKVTVGREEEGWVVRVCVGAQSMRGPEENAGREKGGE